MNERKHVCLYYFVPTIAATSNIPEYCIWMTATDNDVMNNDDDAQTYSSTVQYTQTDWLSLLLVFVSLPFCTDTWIAQRSAQIAFTNHKFQTACRVALNVNLNVFCVWARVSNSMSYLISRSIYICVRVHCLKFRWMTTLIYHVRKSKNCVRHVKWSGCHHFIIYFAMTVCSAARQ